MQLSRSSSRLAVDWLLCLVTQNSRGRKLGWHTKALYVASSNHVYAMAWHAWYAMPFAGQTNRLHLHPSSKDIVFELAWFRSPLLVILHVDWLGLIIILR
jgi:hypothetical protein